MDYEESQRLVAGAEAPEDLEDVSLRPRKFEEYIGQEKVRANLSVFIEAAKQRKEPLDHVLLYGPPGLGKTTLAGIIASELGVSLRITTGPAIEKAADLAGLLTNLNDFDVLFIDEIHRLNRAVEEILYPAMEDFAFDIIMGKGPAARSLRLDLPKFTLVGATTRAGLLTAPLRDRFGVISPAGNVRRLRAFPDRASFRKYFTRRNRRYGSARDRPALARHAQNRKQASEART